MVADTVGLALSGGGIRSATISLGFLRVLGREGLIPGIDYLSSVSGGSYIAGFLCSRYVPAQWRGDIEIDRGTASPEQPREAAGFDPFAGPDGEEGLNHLRQSGRHLLPGGSGDWLKLIVLMLRSWLAIHVMIGITLVTMLLLLKIPQGLWDEYGLDLEAGWADQGLLPDLWPSMWMHGYPVSHWLIASWILPLAGVPLVLALALFWAYFLTRGQPGARDGRWRRAWQGPGLWSALLIWGIAIVLLVLPVDDEFVGAKAGAVAAAGFAAVALAGYLMAEIGDALLTDRALDRGPDGKDVPRSIPDRVRRLFFEMSPAPEVQTGGAPEPGDRRNQPTPLCAPAPGPAFARVQEDRVRTRLTNWAERLFLLALGIAALGIVDSLATTLVVRGREMVFPPIASTLLAVLVPIARQAVLRAGQKGEAKGWLGKLLARFGHAIALGVGLLFAIVLGTMWAIVAHWLAWFHAPVGMVENSLWFGPWPGFLLTVLIGVVLCWFVSLAFSFLNLSSFTGFYSSNLRRAYLGASNTNRWSGRRWSVNKDHVDDDIALEAYYDGRLRPPLHLINCTINDTASHASNLTQRDRRGKPLIVSPAGYLYPGDDLRGSLRGVPFPTRPPQAAAKAAEQPMPRFEDPSPASILERLSNAGRVDTSATEVLPLSTWIGISGAAASTGIGQYGSLGLSLLAGLSAVRLGYWWKPGILRGGGSRARQRSVQLRMKDEFFGHFNGTDGDRWYISDGGHFENTGAYELIRRRVALIVVLDNGADPGYEFTDLVTLTRRVRTDFNADLRFDYTDEELDNLFGSSDARVVSPLRGAFAPLRQLALAADEANPATGPYAAIGRVVYDQAGPAGIEDRATSTVIWVKPRVCGAEALDLLAYARSNRPFPQESTLDQNFSEPQWDSYYRLGSVMASSLFIGESEGRWHPRSMRPSPV